MASFTLKSAQFRREREQTWRELEGLLARAEKDGLGSLTAAELNRLPVLYRSAASSLSSMPIHSRSTSAVCSPRSGAGRASGGASSPKRMALAT